MKKNAPVNDVQITMKFLSSNKATIAIANATTPKVI
jgi:hypothetical protein